MTVAKEESDGWIKEMGYIIATPIKLEPSYYKLKDGTIIKALIQVHHLTPVVERQESTVISTNIITAYVPHEKRHPAAYQPYNPRNPSTKVIDDDMEQEVLRENFSTYELSDGTILSVKTVAGQISKSDLLTIDGEPVYNVQLTPITKIKKK